MSERLESKVKTFYFPFSVIEIHERTGLTETRSPKRKHLTVVIPGSSGENGWINRRAGEGIYRLRRVRPKHGREQGTGVVD